MFIEALRHSTFQGLPDGPSAVTDNGEGADTGVGDLMMVGQLLCARVCHDLIGPTAAINAGEELIRDGDGIDDARDLIAESARQLTGRLSFFRALFGQGGSSSAGPGLTEARALAEGFLLGSRVTLEWPDGFAGDADLSAGGSRLVLSMLMLAADALPRGGTVRLRLHQGTGHVCIELQAAGPRVRLAPELLQALQSQDATGVSARTVHAFYLSRLVRGSRATLGIEATEGQPLTMELRLPTPPARAAA